ncbi:MAG: diguanylate cyclase domain-containing protein [Acidimicrobiales bacterium]
MPWSPWPRRRRRPPVDASSSGAPGFSEPESGARSSAALPEPVHRPPDARGLGLSDELTGLQDRLCLKRRLEGMVVLAANAGPRPAMLLFDLDAFGQVNDTHGRVLGDELLTETGRRLVSAISYRGAVYRSGGDEFTILLDQATPEEAVGTAEALRSTLKEPLHLLGASLQVSVSVAVVMLGDRQRADALLRDADLTMYRAKATGGDRVESYGPDLDEWAAGRKLDTESLARELEELRVENQGLAEQAAFDPGTGLPNQAAFDADHLQLHARRGRTGGQYAVLLAGIDGFDDYEKQLGESASRKLVWVVANTVNDAVRQGDRAYRHGPREVSVLLAGAMVRDAVVAGERFRSKVRGLGIPHPTNPSGVVTISVAVVEAGFRHSNAKDVVAEAEALLGEGGAAGPDRVSWPH